MPIFPGTSVPSRCSAEDVLADRRVFMVPAEVWDRFSAALDRPAGAGGYDVPVVILTRLGVDVSEQGRALGRALVVDALRRVDQVAEEVGIRACSSTQRTRRPWSSTCGWQPSSRGLRTAIRRA